MKAGDTFVLSHPAVDRPHPAGGESLENIVPDVLDILQKQGVLD